MISKAILSRSRHVVWCGCILLFATSSWSGVSLQPASKAITNSLSAAGGSYLPKFNSQASGLTFTSNAKNLVANQNLSRFLNVFYRDIASGSNTLVSVNQSGLAGGNGHSTSPAVSGDGRYIAFVSNADDLVPGDTNRAADIFLRDLDSKSTVLVSAGAQGIQANAPSTTPLISQDGRFIFFESAASNLVPNDTNNASDVFRRDMQSGTVALVSTSSGGGVSSSVSHLAAISQEGRFGVFVSRSKEFVSGVTNLEQQIYVRDMNLSRTIWVSAFHPVSTNAPADYPCTDPIITPDGAYVAYKAGPVGVVRYALAGGTKPEGWIWAPEPANTDPLSVTADGRFIAYATAGATNRIVRLDAEGAASEGRIPVHEVTTVPGHFSAPRASTNGQIILFVGPPNLLAQSCSSSNGLYFRDMSTNVLTPVLLSCSLPHLEGSALPELSPDGRFVAWDSSSEIIPGDLNNDSDIFFQPLNADSPVLISTAAAQKQMLTGQGPARVMNRALTANGSHLAFTAGDGSWIHGDTNRWLDPFVIDLASGQVDGGPFAWIYSTNNGIPATNLVFYSDSTERIAMSADGRYLFDQRIVFYYGYPQIAPATLSPRKIYRTDRLTGLTQHVFQLYYIYGENPGPSISADGRFMAVLIADNVREIFDTSINDSGSSRDVVVTDFGPPYVPGTTSVPVTRPLTNFVLSVGVADPFSAAGNCSHPTISPDGHWVVFPNRSIDIVTNNPDNSFHLIAATVPPAHLRLLDRDAEGRPFLGGATNPVFSADSQWVAFEAPALRSIYLQNLPSPQEHANLLCQDCRTPTLSADARYIAYATWPFQGASQIAVQDRQLGTAEIISVPANTNDVIDGSSTFPLISPDGRYVVFTSKANNLVPGDTNRVADIFIRDRATARTILASANYRGTGSGNGKSIDPVLSGDGLTLAFRSFASDLVPGDYNDLPDVFVIRLGSPDSDNDGMADDWEVAYFGDLTRNGSGDLDADGATDATEFRAGTDPTNRNSVFRVLSLTYRGLVPAPGATLIWSAVPGKAYRIQFKRNVTDLWSDVPGQVAATTSTANHFWADDAPGNPTPAFFRVVLVE